MFASLRYVKLKIYAAYLCDVNVKVDGRRENCKKMGNLEYSNLMLYFSPQNFSQRKHKHFKIQSSTFADR